MNNTEHTDRAHLKPGMVMVNGKILFFSICLISVLAFVAGTRINEMNDTISQVIGTPRANKTLDLSSVQRTYQYLLENYDGKLDNEALIDGANKGLTTAAGDKYTVYLNAKDAQALQNDLDGEIGGGIGAEIGIRNDRPTVVRALPDHPAEKAGVQKGDTILRVNDEDVSKKDVDVVVAKIRGKEGTTVKLEVGREGKVRTFTITRAVVNNPSVRSEVRNHVGILTISRFDGETGPLARKAAESFKQQDVRGVILDLRGDGGGYVNGAIDVASLWVDDKKEIVSQRKNNKVVDQSEANGDPILGNLKTVVLVDEGTASASEIVAGALRDYGKATLVGKKTFGKGSVQQLIDLDDGAQLKVTIAKWYTPKGHNINGNGLQPDRVIELTIDDINHDRDPQLDAALNGLK
ncbi:MAG TPA: S41 family peptidase [Candidatus Saccharimonadales bacterium]